MLKKGHILRTQEFTRQWVEGICRDTVHIKQSLAGKKGNLMYLRRESNIHASTCMAFYESSTRTIGSFMRAGDLLGLTVHNPGNMKAFSSAVKGESLEDTIRVLCGQMHDFIVLRHDEEGAANRAARIANDYERESGHQAWIINAGDGPGDHPTQALLDAFTLREKFGRLDDLKIVFGGDLRYGRTIRSLVCLLEKFGRPQFVFVSMPELSLSDDIRHFLVERNIPHEEVTSVDAALELGGDFNAWYWTRSQSERVDEKEMVDGKKIKEVIAAKEPKFWILPEHLERMGKDTILMHPLPRVNEIHRECDRDPRAWYFRQSDNGVPVRMVLYDKFLAQEWL